ncbi:DUF2865 domain-containing protein [uncultured Roseibium sp.]|uniref:DUF2865 domain-containing protein n=1 Tax=uncultured Roseibium sp. TaxID=1936171 RepID=UPI0026236D3E|nr:DUF2865 domain-containing protein [uncultured Roseibium sp.]
MARHSKARSVRIAQAAGVLVTLLLPLNAAYAATCAALKSELRQLESGSRAKSPAAVKWSTAKRQQEKAISAATRDARHFGCSRNPTAKCQDLNQKIKRMKSNLSAIERQLSKAGGTNTKNTRRIRQVRASLERQSCNAPKTQRQRQASSERPVNAEKPKSLLARLFNPESKAQQTSARTGDRETSSVRSQHKRDNTRRRLPSGSAFRTLCVRTCDGYFFPVSFSAGKSQFANDEARCSEICPAAPTELYIYRNPGGDQSQMTSLAGVPYADQPFAFRYKSEFVEGCSCRQSKQAKTRSAWSEVGTSSGQRFFFADISAGLPRRTQQPSLGSTYEEERAKPSALAMTPLLPAQLPRYDDPGTLFNLEKGFDVTSVAAFAQVRMATASQASATDTASEDGFPLLTLRKTEDGSIEAVSAAPVFKTEDPGFRPAPERSSPVRVVGPEYFVAQ